MCFNSQISIKTFLFGIFTLLIIYYNNLYSSHKIIEFKNPYTYFFMMSFIIMQLFEYLLWENINNLFINHLVSILGLLLLTIQPIASLTMLNNTQIKLRNKLIFIYSIPAFLYVLYQILTNHINTSISKIGHLKWNWTFDKNKFVNFFVYIFYLYFLYFSLFSNKYYNEIIITLPLFLIMYYFYYKDGSAGSLWCFSINIIMVYYLIKLIIVNLGIETI